MKGVTSIFEQKVEMTKLLLAIEDQSVLDEIYAILRNATDDDVDWYENLDAEDKASIERGREDIAAGRVSSQDEMMERIKTYIR